MKKMMTLALGLGLIAGTTTFAFAQTDTKKTATKKASTKKPSTKKTGTTTPAPAPKQ